MHIYLPGRKPDYVIVNKNPYLRYQRQHARPAMPLAESQHSRLDQSQGYDQRRYIKKRIEYIQYAFCAKRICAQYNYVKEGVSKRSKLYDECYRAQLLYKILNFLSVFHRASALSASAPASDTAAYPPAWYHGRHGLYRSQVSCQTGLS